MVKVWIVRDVEPTRFSTSQDLNDVGHEHLGLYTVVTEREQFLVLRYLATTEQCASEATYFHGI
jgi:hypothetical protein